MKIRSGFVSNSSSSSFVAVGIGPGGYKSTGPDAQRWEDLLNAMGMPLRSYDYDDFYSGSSSPYAGKASDYDYGTVKMTDGSDICLYGGCEFYFAGLDAMPLFKKDMRLSEIKKLFQKTVKERYKVKVKLADIEFESGEVSSE